RLARQIGSVRAGIRDVHVHIRIIAPVDLQTVCARLGDREVEQLLVAARAERTEDVLTDREDRRRRKRVPVGVVRGRGRRQRVLVADGQLIRAGVHDAVGQRGPCCESERQERVRLRLGDRPQRYYPAPLRVELHARVLVERSRTGREQERLATADRHLLYRAGEGRRHHGDLDAVAARYAEVRVG